MVAIDESALGTENYRHTTLEPNQIFVDDVQMDEVQWSCLAFSLGMSTRGSDAPTSETKRFVQKLKNRRKDPASRIDDLLDTLLSPICRAHPKVGVKAEASFSRDAIPHGVSDENVQAGVRTQLPTPKPSFTFGYKADAFRKRYWELQNGIINDENNEPCNLGAISQPIQDIYWPFLVVDTRPLGLPGAMLAAKHACAGAAATCNNAIMTLSNAAQRPNEYSTSPSLQWDPKKMAQSFSLAIDGQQACLSSHNSQGVVPHTMTTIRSYNLEDEKEVQALCSRLESIMIWAENCRLVTIAEVLDRLDRRVHCGIPSQTPLRADFGEDVWQNRFGIPEQKKSRLRTTFRERLSSLSRARKPN